MKWTKLFHKGADCGMRLGVRGQDLLIFRELSLKIFISLYYNFSTYIDDYGQTNQLIFRFIFLLPV